MSFKRWVYQWVQFRKRMGPRVFFYVVLAATSALSGYFLGPLIPQKIVDNLGRVDVQPILQALSGSMLTISTFSLSIVVSANANAIASTTPRAFKLLLEDQGTQDMLSRFLGAFVFSTITLVILPLGFYGGGGRVILLAFTAWLVVLIIVSFIRWFLVIRELGSMSHVLGKIETATNLAINEYLNQMLAGCNAFTDATALDLENLHEVRLDIGEYIHMIDESVLQNVAKKYNLEVYLNVIEGDFISAGQPACYVRGDITDQVVHSLRGAIFLGNSRNMEGDPRYGILMLEQTASKALSAAVNDAGTASGCIHTAYRLFIRWKDNEEGQIRNTRLWKKFINYERMLLEFFEPITHNAGDAFSVHNDVILTLGALHKSDVETIQEAAVNVGHVCYKRAMNQLSDPRDKEELRRVFQQSGIA